MKSKNIIPLKDLNLTDRFLFDTVMEDPHVHQLMLNIILDGEITLLGKTEAEKELRTSPVFRSVRIDIFAMDEEQKIYLSEMQQQRKSDLARRSRFYQALLDSGLLEPGVPSYNLLNDTCIIMITTFDLFGYGRYKYTFQPYCSEELECILEDGATRIFLNTRGTNDHEVSKELIEFLHYCEKTTETKAEDLDSERLRAIHAHVQKVKVSEEVGVKYIQLMEEKQHEREEGRREGEEVGLRKGKKAGQAQLIGIIRKKCEKGKSTAEIADMLEMEETRVQEITKLLTSDEMLSDLQIAEYLINNESEDYDFR